MVILVFAFTGKWFVSGTCDKIAPGRKRDENVRPVHKGMSIVQEEKGKQPVPLH
ncbi:hypothetical protein NB646_08650 [Oxalobacter aliiformigenes]|uniref:Uncharacterized protein n=1 Tax=Oxalobacter aliiformigenes TaxID=2946593 RepID=A0A9E9LDV0_9BURK|nr:hypothetical protein [Oxalobacter aliiformigenes]WAV90889.1 hypothetical protein NB646_08650 [Oxalobacter aliiformigenes]